MLVKFFLIIFILISQLVADEIIVKKNDILEIYFDMPNLYLLKNNASLKYQVKEYLSKKKKKLKYKESIVYTTKSNKTHIFRVKHYKHTESIEEKHPLLSLVKRKDRSLLIELLRLDGIKYPMKLKYVFENITSSKDKENNITTYQTLFNEMKEKNKLFNIEFQYPYYLNLFYAICFGLLGLIIIKVFFKKSHNI